MRNHVGQLSAFVRRWDNGPGGSELGIVRVGPGGHHNDDGTADCALATTFIRRDASFGASLEPRIRPIVLAFSDVMNWITYSSCGGHVGSISRDPHVGILPRDDAERAQIWSLLGEWARDTNARPGDGRIEIVESVVTSEGCDLAGIDVLGVGADNEGGMHDLLARATETFLDLLVRRGAAPGSRLGKTIVAIGRWGAASAAHGSSTLLSHLFGTYSILASWNRPRRDCEAGLCHALYGTGSYDTHVLDDASGALAALVGVDVDGLARAYARRDFGVLLRSLRAEAIARLVHLARAEGTAPCIAGMKVAPALGISERRRTTVTLAHLVAANAADQAYWQGVPVPTGEIAELLYVVVDEVAATEWLRLWNPHAVTL